MTTLEGSFSRKGKTTGVEIKHFPVINPKLDIVLNLDYPSQEDREILLSILTSESEAKAPKEMAEKIEKIEKLTNKDLSPRFFVKEKSLIQEQVDFILGRTKDDLLFEKTRSDINKTARYGFAGTTNEFSLSKTIKELVASNEFQESAKQYGFTGLSSIEPIVAVSERKANKKYLIYKYIKELEVSADDELSLRALAGELRMLFRAKGIASRDLNSRQFIITGGKDKRSLCLIDIEAYTRIKKGFNLSNI
jgi:hypothetical protein